MSNLVLKIGSKNFVEVETLQRQLHNKGYLALAAGIDGKFGQLTQEAVIKFQKDNQLEPDGVVGKKTSEKLGGITLPQSPVDFKLKASLPTHILTAQQRELLANKIDALIPTGPVDLFDGPVIRWLVDKFDEVIIKLLPTELVEWLSDINQGLTTANQVSRDNLVRRLNANIDIWLLPEETEEKIIGFLVDLTISALTVGGNIDTAIEKVGKKYALTI